MRPAKIKISLCIHSMQSLCRPYEERSHVLLPIKREAITLISNIEADQSHCLGGEGWTCSLVGNAVSRFI